LRYRVVESQTEPPRQGPNLPRFSGLGLLRFSAIFFAACIASGCAIVEKLHADGTAERTTSFLAPVLVFPDASDAATAVRVSGIGLGVGPQTAMLGAYDVSAVYLDPECRIVIMPQRELELQNLHRILGDTSKVCVVEKTKGAGK
jgi:hypothetical protein